MSNNLRITLGGRHSDWVRMAAAFEGLSEGEMIRRMIEAYKPDMTIDLTNDETEKGD